MDRNPVSSSNISSVGYDADSQTLEIEFHDGGIYQYAGVPESEYEGLISSGSQGRYFHDNIKGRYPFVKL